jgi:predicted nucleotidyltransferase
MARTKTMKRRINKRVKKSSMKKKHKRKSTKRRSLRGGAITAPQVHQMYEQIKKISYFLPQAICEEYKEMKKANLPCTKPNWDEMAVEIKYIANEYPELICDEYKKMKKKKIQCTQRSWFKKEKGVTPTETQIYSPPHGYNIWGDKFNNMN